MTAWNKEKVSIFKRAFADFLQYVIIDSKETGEGPLRLYAAQKRLLSEVFTGLENDIHWFVILKARQLGCSTIVRALIVFWAYMHPGLRVALVYDTAKNAKEARQEISLFLERLPKSHSIPITTHSREFLQLSNGSRISYLVAGTKKTSNTTGGLGRSLGFNCCGCTEMSSWADLEGLRAFERSLAQRFGNRLFVWESPLALDTPIPVPRGWTTIGKIKEGDHVYDDRGKVCRVVGASPVFVNRKCYKITFGNGESVVADGAHKWQVMERRYYTNQQWKQKTVTTEELDQERHRIEAAKPLDMPDIWLPIDPYVLGAWLGDGTTGQVAITAGDEDMDEIRSLISERGYSISPISKHDWRVGKFTILGQRTLFNRLKLLGNKHIPPVYLRASERQRRELLAGLMDTDGHISPDSFKCEFANTSVRLINDVAELLSSLGIKAKRSQLSAAGKLRTFPNGRTYACAASERLIFHEHPELKVFNLSRKRAVQEKPRTFTHRKAKYIRISSVEETGSVPVRCLEVDTPSHLFLVGKSMVPTHNTARGFNVFHDLWKEAKADDLTKKAIFIGWWAKEIYSIDKDSALFERYGIKPPTEDEQQKINIVRERYGHEVTMEQLAWYRHEYDPDKGVDDDSEHAGQDIITQELPWFEEEAFLKSGSEFFPSDRLSHAMRDTARLKAKGYNYYMSDNFLATVLEPADVARRAMLKVWEEPDPTGQYVVGADPAFGSNENSDRFCAQVLRCYADGVDQVAEFNTTRIVDYQFAWVLAHLCGAYGNARLLVELNGPGHTVWNEFRTLEILLTRGYMREAALEIGMTDIFKHVRQYLWARQDSLSKNPTAFQWETNGKRKEQIMTRLRDLFHLQAIRVRSFECLEEMSTMVRDQGAIHGYPHDDRVMAIALACRAWDDQERKKLIAQDRTRENETKRRDLSPVDMQQLFSERLVSNFFAEQKRSNIRAARAARRGNRWSW